MKSWHFLIHAIPPRPLYLRAKVRQRLERLGAVAIKNSVYALPAGEETLEDLQWLAGEIVSGGGQAFIVAGSVLSGVTDAELVAAFRSARTTDYESLLREAKADGADLPRLRRRLGEIRAIDFFEAPKGKEAETMLARLEAKQTKARPLAAGKVPRVKGAT